MNEYVFEDLIMNPKSPGLESLIGKEVYCNDVPLACLDHANEHRGAGILREVRHESTDYPFRVETPEGGILGFVCIIPKKEESEPEYVPFKSKEEFVEKYMQIKEGVAFGPFEDSLLQCGIWLKERGTDSDVYCMVNEIWNDGVALGRSKTYNVQNISGEYSTVIETTSWEDLYKGFTFLDGSPCGKLIEAEHE